MIIDKWRDFILMNENFFFYFYQLFLKHWIQLIQSYNYAFQSMSSSQCAYVDSSEERIAIEWLNHSAQWISSISIIESNLDIIQLFLKHWIQLIQSYKHVFQSMSNSQRAYVDSSEKVLLLGEQSFSALNLFNLIY